jgi:hypothetical protein
MWLHRTAPLDFWPTWSPLIPLPHLSSKMLRPLATNWTCCNPLSEHMHVYKPLRLMVYHPGSIYALRLYTLNHRKVNAKEENNGYVVLKWNISWEKGWQWVHGGGITSPAPTPRFWENILRRHERFSSTSDSCFMITTYRSALGKKASWN